VSLRLPRPATPALLLGLALVVTGCGANFEAQTYQTRASADGTNTAVGGDRAAQRPPAAAGSGEATTPARTPRSLTLVNDGPEDDRWSVTTRRPLGRDAGRRRRVRRVELPRLGPPAAPSACSWSGLTEDLRPGRFVPMAVTFERNGEVTVRSRSRPPGEYDEDREHSENFHEIGEPRSTAGGASSGSEGLRAGEAAPEPSALQRLSRGAHPAASVRGMAPDPAPSAPSHRCSECGASVAKWLGRCPECQAWGTLAEVRTAGARPASLRAPPP
jgi:hypothetical protein